MNDINTGEITDVKTQQFALDIRDGLQSTPKRLPSKYFYDEIGDKLFQDIMQLEEYYLTRSEYEILNTYKSEILKVINRDGGFDLFELGAGDGYKTKLLLKHFVDEKVDFAYHPIDISGNVLQELSEALTAEIPDLKVRPLEGDYFKMLGNISHNSEARKLILFLGSNIGNFSQEEALKFLTMLRDSLEVGDYTLIGVDLKKDPAVILAAYNDSSGTTKSFNLNLLNRINDTLGAGFDTDKFIHSPSYDPQTGECRSYLLSTEEQIIDIPGLEASYHFRSWEPIHMEISKKYHLQELELLAEKAGFELVRHFTDSKGYFVDSLWRAK
ncbi:MAG: L-histidine N(alpha)-methyltransferase [Bacteroidota bacterium]